ncbi:hypothetical protein LY39_00927 [Roseinatronobacter bogoriensis subsp. barguzinensis]|nr:hypothetical protein [Rhodobaca bogoriensis DSM 18756]TDW39899.1 hypothetical protein LY39_00927 [Rhodobaca barguzinensis]TDY70948.1 hypothetical protein EV660_102630 [Rhodobaca bogoriensis DSM 18756]
MAFVTLPPPPAPAKAFSPFGCGRIFPLFSRVMQEGLSTGLGARRPEGGLSGPIFSGPDDCAALVQTTTPMFLPLFFAPHESLFVIAICTRTVLASTSTESGPTDTPDDPSRPLKINLGYLSDHQPRLPWPTPKATSLIALIEKRNCPTYGETIPRIIRPGLIWLRVS